MTQKFDVVVIGGGAAGLSGATALARSRRSVLVLDSGSPRNAPAEGVHGFLTRDGMSPLELLAAGRAEVEHYGGQVVHGPAGTVRTVRGRAGSFEIIRADGSVVEARRVLLTTGLVDELPAVPGVRELWGGDVVHCPYCHGWEVRDRGIAVIGTSPHSVHQALLFRQLTDDLVYFAVEPLTGEAVSQLTARGVRIVEGPVAALEIADGHLIGVRRGDGTVVPRTAAVVSPGYTVGAAVVAELGLATVPHPMGGEVVDVDDRFRTSVPGVFAAGNVVDPSAQVVLAAGAGMRAGAMINFDLVTEETEHAVSEHQHEHEGVDLDAMFTQEHWDERYGAGDRIWSGKPNVALIAETETLTPGTALEVGSGEGADAVWLAARGWSVTALDISEVALTKGAAHAADAGVGDRITWKRYDARSDDDIQGTYDLVTASFMHLPQPSLGLLQRRLAAAVAPGGSLLLVGHHPMDMEAHPHPLWSRHPEMRFTAEEVAAALSAGEWETRAADTRARERKDPETGEVMTIHDAVLHAVRRP
jgi:thioredoxin reductase/2-polyprenyl-3-methyl-5-hydroxy-6-metoxy-1,4-benzoquinol methylase